MFYDVSISGGFLFAIAEPSRIVLEGMAERKVLGQLPRLCGMSLNPIDSFIDCEANCLRVGKA